MVGLILIQVYITFFSVSLYYLSFKKKKIVVAGQESSWFELGSVFLWMALFSYEGKTNSFSLYI
jgi:hypothetical protein